MGCVSGLRSNMAEEELDSPPLSDRPLSEEERKSESLSNKQKPRLPNNVKMLGQSPDFPFVESDHNLHPSVMPLFKKVRVLGQGASCEVAHMTRKEDKSDFAVKIMKRDDKLNPILFKQEYYLLSTLDHPNILGYKDCYMDKNNFYICTELCKGGELFDKIKEYRTFNEVKAAEIIKTIISAIAHCHDMDIVHRDLKPENIVFRTKAQKDLVIIDFGDAKKIVEDKIYTDFVGTAFYLAPECVRDREGWELKKSDMWTIGVIGYLLLNGRPPFYGRDNKEILRKIINARIVWPKRNKLSNSAKDFVERLMRKDPKDRLSARRALQHRWLSGSAGTEDLGGDLLKSISNYSKSSKLKKVLVRMLANEMTKKDHIEIKRQFAKMDADGNGQVNLDELTSFLHKGGGTKTEAHARASHIIEQVGQDGVGEIGIEEWTNAQLAARIGNDKKLLRAQFDRIDQDNDGFINHDELSKLFNWTLTKDLVSLMIKEIDENQDGKISYDEFVKAMKDGSLEKVLTGRKHMTKAMTQMIRKELEAEDTL